MGYEFDSDYFKRLGTFAKCDVIHSVMPFARHGYEYDSSHGGVICKRCDRNHHDTACPYYFDEDAAFENTKIAFGQKSVIAIAQEKAKREAKELARQEALANRNVNLQVEDRASRNLRKEYEAKVAAEKAKAAEAKLKAEQVAEQNAKLTAAVQSALQTAKKAAERVRSRNLRKEYEAKVAAAEAKLKAEQVAEQDATVQAAAERDRNRLTSLELAEMNKMMEENEEMLRHASCKICYETGSDCLLLPCGHVATCGECAKSLRYCPICRNLIKGTTQLMDM
jgi:hypothetical protein